MPHVSESESSDGVPVPLDTGSTESRLAGYRPQVRRHIAAMVRDPAQVDDLTQDTYARALRHVDQLRDPQAALAWLYRIATNVTLDWVRARRPDPVPLDDEIVTPRSADDVAHRPGSLIGAALERAEMSECVRRYLQELSDDYRVAILLHDVHGLTNPEIARVVGCSLATAKIRVHRARRRLRETLADVCTFETDERGVLVCNPR